MLLISSYAYECTCTCVQNLLESRPPIHKIVTFVDRDITVPLWSWIFLEIALYGRYRSRVSSRKPRARTAANSCHLSSRNNSTPIDPSKIVLQRTTRLLRTSQERINKCSLLTTISITQQYVLLSTLSSTTVSKNTRCYPNCADHSL